MKRIIIVLSAALAIMGCSKIEETYSLANGLELKGYVTEAEWNSLSVPGTKWGWSSSVYYYPSGTNLWLRERESGEGGMTASYSFKEDGTVEVISYTDAKDPLDNGTRKSEQTWSFDAGSSVLTIGNKKHFKIVGAEENTIYFFEPNTKDKLYCLTRKK